MHGGLCFELQHPPYWGAGELGKKVGEGEKVGVGGAQLPTGYSLFLGAFWTGKLGLFAVTLALEQASIESLLSMYVYSVLAVLRFLRRRIKL